MPELPSPGSMLIKLRGVGGFMNDKVDEEDKELSESASQSGDVSQVQVISGSMNGKTRSLAEIGALIGIMGVFATFLLMFPQYINDTNQSLRDNIRTLDTKAKELAIEHEKELEKQRINYEQLIEALEVKGQPAIGQVAKCDAPPLDSEPVNVPTCPDPTEDIRVCQTSLRKALGSERKAKSLVANTEGQLASLRSTCSTIETEKNDLIEKYNRLVGQFNPLNNEVVALRAKVGSALLNPTGPIVFQQDLKLAGGKSIGLYSDKIRLAYTDNGLSQSLSVNGDIGNIRAGSEFSRNIDKMNCQFIVRELSGSYNVKVLSLSVRCR